MTNGAAGRWVALLAGLASAWLLLCCAPALAHATLVGASPPRGGARRSSPPSGSSCGSPSPWAPSSTRWWCATQAATGSTPGTAAWTRTTRGSCWRASGGCPRGRTPWRGEGTTEAAGAHGGGHRAGQEGGGTGEAASPDRRDPVAEPAAGRTAEISHGLALGATAFLAGLAPFAVLVWLPATGQSGVGRAAIRPFGLAAWVLLLALAVAGAGELSSYAVRASGEALNTELFWRTLVDSRVGAVWLDRLGLAHLLAAAVAAAAGAGRTSVSWAA